MNDTGFRIAGPVGEVSTKAALQALREHEGPLLIDLDETLYLRNSTEDFLDCARPGFLALILLRVLDVLRPWRFTGGESTRDVWRVAVVQLLLPWTWRRWRARVGPLARAHGNRDLLHALRECEQTPCIVTAGFTPIVVPLVRELGLPHAVVVANSPWRFSDRARGKLARALGVLGPETVADSLVLTDNADDTPLLEACARPLRTVWPQARYRRALSAVYLPGEYISRVKRPGERYILRGIVQEDLAFWIIASIALAASPVLHALGLCALMLSFWAIYETGYVDNDHIAARFESEPKLSGAFHEVEVATPRFTPWLWALGAGFVSIALLRWPQSPAWQDLAAWAGVLGATAGLFHIYNRVDKGTRVWLYPGLQLARSAALVVVVPLTLAGAAALAAHALARWMPYFAYRSTATDTSTTQWPDVPMHLMRVLVFCMLMLFLAVAAGPAAVLNTTAAALLAWNLVRARGEISVMWRQAQRIDRAQP